MNNPEINVNPGDEIVIVIPEGVDEDELVIDFDELGIDLEQLGDDVNIVIQVEGADDLEMDLIDDDPYGIVYYEFPPED